MSATATRPAGTSTQRRSDVRRTLFALFATALGVFPLNELFTDRGWLIDVWLAMIIVVGPAAILRRTRAPAAWQIWIGVALLVPWLTVNYIRDHAVLGFIPLGGAWHEVGHLMTNLHRTTSNEAAPLHTTVAIRLALCTLLGLVAALVDLVAVVGRRGALAGVPLLIAFTVAGAVPRHPVSWIWFIFAAVGFLVLLALDSGDDLHRWGHYVPRTARVRRAAGAMSAQRIAVIAIAAAVVLPLFIPANSRNFVANLFHNRGGSGPSGFGNNAVNGSGTGGIDPFVSMFGQLNRNTKIKLLTVHVSSNDPKFGTKGSQPFYLRTNVLSEFTGSGWRPGPNGAQDGIASSQFDASPGTPYAPHTLPFRASISVDALNSNPPVFASPASISGLSDQTDWSKQDQLLTGTTVNDGTTFNEFVDQPDPTVGELSRATGADPAMSAWLKLPPIANYVRRTTAQIVAGKQTPYEVALAISAFFARPSNNFAYSLTAPRGNSGDALTDFLKNRVGYCQQYASTMAVMLRLSGVPARVVLGYTHGVPNASGTFTVTNFDAHAWVEAYFAGIGWVPFDPTPITGIAGGAANDLTWAPHKSSAGSGFKDEQNPHPQGTTAPSITPTQHHNGGGATVAKHSASGTGIPAVWLAALALILLVAVVLLIPAFIRWRRHRRRLARARTGDTEALWQELSDTATDLGYVWSSARTPRQVARWLGGSSPDADTSLATLATAVEVARYAPGVMTRDRGADLVHDLSTVTAGLRSRRTTAERLRAKFWPASLRRAK